MANKNTTGNMLFRFELRNDRQLARIDEENNRYKKAVMVQEVFIEIRVTQTVIKRRKKSMQSSKKRGP